MIKIIIIIITSQLLINNNQSLLLSCQQTTEHFTITIHHCCGRYLLSLFAFQRRSQYAPTNVYNDHREDEIAQIRNVRKRNSILQTSRQTRRRFSLGEVCAKIPCNLGKNQRRGRGVRPHSNRKQQVHFQAACRDRLEQRQ